MKEEASRTVMILGSDAYDRLSELTVAVVGLGGVGGHCAEALARSGVGSLLLVDADTVARSNMNRQLFATRSAIGMKKTIAAKNRLSEVSDCNIATVDMFLLPGNLESAFLSRPDFIVDAIDTVSTKIALAKYAHENAVPIISCMGVGKRLDPTQLVIGDLYEVTSCPIARVMRRELRKANILSLPVVYSKEMPLKTAGTVATGEKAPPGSVAFVPSAAGLALASYVVRYFAGK